MSDKNKTPIVIDHDTLADVSIQDALRQPFTVPPPPEDDQRKRRMARAYYIADIAGLVLKFLVFAGGAIILAYFFKHKEFMAFWNQNFR